MLQISPIALGQVPAGNTSSIVIEGARMVFSDFFKCVLKKTKETKKRWKTNKEKELKRSGKQRKNKK